MVAIAFVSPGRWISSLSKLDRITVFRGRPQGAARGIRDCHSCYMGQKLRELYSCVTIVVWHILAHSQPQLLWMNCPFKGQKQGSLEAQCFVLRFPVFLTAWICEKLRLL